MSGNEILLALSGSQVSEYGARVAFDLAQRMNYGIKAVHVINTAGAWAFLGVDTAGFVGSGLTVKAYEGLKHSLEEIGSKLQQKFAAVCEGHAINTETVMRAGDPVDIIVKEAQDSKLIVIGHRMRGEADRQRHVDVASVAEGVVQASNKPVLIVRCAPLIVNKLNIFTSVDHVNLNLIEHSLLFAKRANLAPHLVCLATGTHEEVPIDFMNDLRKENSLLQHVPIELRYLPGAVVQPARSLWTREPVSLSLPFDGEALNVVPTRKLGEDRITILGNVPASFVRETSLSHLLFWPEDGEVSFDAAVCEASSSLARR